MIVGRRRRKQYLIRLRDNTLSFSGLCDLAIAKEEKDSNKLKEQLEVLALYITRGKDTVKSEYDRSSNGK